MNTPHPVEVELKLALPPPQAARFIKLMARRRTPGVEQALLTRYFDTPDFALSAQGIALRVRRIGRRWLQTLKTEGERSGGLSRRAEYEVGISGRTPDWSRFPAEAQARVPEALRAQLVPVFETHFKRTTWLLAGEHGALIEVALDEGEVHAGTQRQPLCEIELELKSGQPDALFALALGWAAQLDYLPLDVSKAERGVRLAHQQSPQPVKSLPLALKKSLSVEAGFAAVCQACLSQFQANLPGVLDSTDVEYVHQARVALRRLRAALRLFRPVCEVPQDLQLNLRALVAALGPARDWDVLCGETLPPIAAHYPDAAGWQQGLGALEAQRAEVRASMRATLQQAHPGAWLLSFQRWLLQRSWRLNPAGGAATETQRFIQLSPLGSWARQALQKGQRRVVRGAQAFEGLNAEQRHRFRIAIKRQRYAAEFFQGLFGGRRYERYLAALQKAQDSLGRSRDAQVANSLLDSTQARAEPMAAFVRGWLAARQADAAPAESARNVEVLLKAARAAKP
ncbi:MAG: CHAD domain-containing protein [Thiobacillus sp.]|nr:CHAD domain-containing protein [Thiobacillus sp.]